MREEPRTCDRCGRRFRGPGSVRADEDENLCLACAHPAHRHGEPAPA